MDAPPATGKRKQSSLLAFFPAASTAPSPSTAAPKKSKTTGEPLRCAPHTPSRFCWLQLTTRWGRKICEGARMEEGQAGDEPRSGRVCGVRGR